MAVKIRSQVKINAYEIIARAVEEGVGYGWRRAHKYEDDPTENTITDKIYDAVIVSLCEVLVFDD